MAFETALGISAPNLRLYEFGLQAERREASCPLPWRPVRRAEPQGAAAPLSVHRGAGHPFPLGNGLPLRSALAQPGRLALGLASDSVLRRGGDA